VSEDVFGAMLPGLLAVVGVAIIVGAALVLWHSWPVLRGAARPKDDVAERVRKWNAYIAPLLRKRLKAQIEVAPAVAFESKADGRVHGVAVWRLLPTIVPDVEFLALADPTGREEPLVRAVAEAAAMRALVGDAARPQRLWGHAAFLYVWPQDVDLDEAATRLTTVEGFAAQHGFDVKMVAKGTPG
jgi:hypothetical protein